MLIAQDKMISTENRCKVCKAVSVLALLIVVLGSTSNAAAQVDSGTFLSDIRFSSYAELDSEKGIPVVLSGMRIPMLARSPENAAVEFLETHGKYLKIDQLEYTLFESRHSTSGGVRVFFRHSSGGRLVIGLNQAPDVDESVLSTSNITSGGSLPGRIPVTGYKIPGHSVDENSERSWYVYFLTLFPADDPAVTLASNLRRTGHAGISRTSIRTLPEERLNKGCPSGDYSGTGTGNVYLPNPIHTEPVRVELKNLCNQVPIILEGKSVSVLPDGMDRSESVTGDFSAEPTTVLFDEASAYYHVDRFITLMRNTGMNERIPEDYQMDISVLSKAGYGSLAAYEVNTLYFGIEPGPFENALYESAIIAHEAMHNLMFWHYESSYLGAGSKEHWVMGEAIPDYVGVAYRARLLGHFESWRYPVIGSYFSQGVTENLPRNLTDPRPHLSGFGKENYVGNGNNVSINNIYDNSMIYSGALMDYDRTDENDHSLSFVISSLNNLEIERAPSFIKGRAALIQAVNECAVIDANGALSCCESGACAAPVIAAFNGRGILGRGGENNDGPAHSPGQTRVSLISVAGNYPSPFPNTTTIEYSLGIEAHVQIRVLDLAGRIVKVLDDTWHRAGAYTIDWRPTEESSGMYLIEFRTSSSAVSHPVFYVK